jgi:hypothetical protein
MPSKEQIAMMISKKRMMKKMAMGGMVDNDDPMVPYRGRDEGQNRPENMSMQEMDKEDPSDYVTSLNENRMNSYSRVPENEVENPNEIEEASMFAKALMRKKSEMMSPENYAMGGLVQAMDTPDGGDKPEEDMTDSTEEPMSSEDVSDEAMDALKKKKMMRRYS